jgi:NRPS condensation-like uncharacterized protein
MLVVDKVIHIPKRFPSQLTDRFLDYIHQSGDMIIQLELQFKLQIDAGRLARATDLSLDVAPVLGCRFVRHWWEPHWERLSTETPHAFVTVKTKHDYESFKVTSIDAYSGPQVRVCLWNYPDGAHILFKVSHYVADAAGVKEVARIISSIYSRLRNDPDYQPEPDLRSSRSVRQILRAVPLRFYPGLFFQFLSDNKASQSSKDILTISITKERDDTLKFVDHILPKEHVSLISEYAHNHEATLNDMLLAAFFRALASTENWDGNKQLKATTTVDLRRYVVERQVSAVANLSLPIWGWPNLNTDLGHDFLSTLNRIATITKRRKQGYLGIETLLGILILLGPFPHYLAARSIGHGVQEKISKGNFAPAFTNMGIIGPEMVVFDSKPCKAQLLPPPVYPPWFMLGVSSYDGTVSLSAGLYSIQTEHIKRFLDVMVAELPR